MTIESIEKRTRRLDRNRREIAQFRQALKHFPANEALSQIYGLQATWDAVRRVATVLIGTPVRDVGVAWGIVGFVENLVDGRHRLRWAVEEALLRWQKELSEQDY